MLLLGTLAVLVVTAALIPTVVRERPGMSQKVAYGTVGFSLLLSGISTVLALGSTGAASEIGFLAYPFAILYSGLGFRIARPATLARALAVGGMAFGGTALAAVMMHWIKVQSVLQE